MSVKEMPVGTGLAGTLLVPSIVAATMGSSFLIIMTA
jgi:hypothetical protein